MCSRQVFAKGEEIAALLNLHLVEPREGLDNAAPTDLTPVITLQDPKKLQYFSWGLSWIDNRTGGRALSTCMRADKLQTSWKRFLRTNNRCLAISNGFYEFSKITRDPYFFTVKDQPYTFIAAFWEYSPNTSTGQMEHRYAIVTVEPNSLVSETHDRMPAILSPDAQAKWLDPEATEEELLELLKPYDGDQMDVKIASKELNNSKNKKFKLENLSDPKTRPLPEQGTLF